MDAAFSSEIHPLNRAKLVHELGAAHAKCHHLLDTRTSFGIFGRRYYLVFQGGIVTRPKLSLSAGPLASIVLGKLDPAILAEFTAREREMTADCVDRAEITRMHPVACPPAASFRLRSAPLTILPGHVQRHAKVNTSDGRSAPTSDGISSAILITVALVASALGLWFLAQAVVMMMDALTDPVIWNILFTDAVPDATTFHVDSEL